MRSERLDRVVAEARACTVCAASLPHGPRPILQAGSNARVVLIGQAPGRKVHDTGIAWNDPSGVRLRGWLGLTDAEFYDPQKVAIVPMGFCYPGKSRSGDAPPRPECAPLWHDRILDLLPNDRLVVILGSYAQERYLPDRSTTLTETVSRWAEYLPDRAVMPHPSPRNRHWLAKNPWFEADAVPAIAARVREVIGR